MMGIKTFISYNRNDSYELKEKIIDLLGKDGKCYDEEIVYPEYMQSNNKFNKEKLEYIKTHITNLIYSSFVTIVILSKKSQQNKRMKWELEFSITKDIKTKGLRGANGIICVLKKDPSSGYTWLDKNYFEEEMSIIKINQDNLKIKEYMTFGLSNNYIDIVTEEEFLQNYNQYIVEAYDKAKNHQLYSVKKLKKDMYDYCR